MRLLLQKIANVVKRFFFIFLDISGILLGVFLTWLGYWIISGHNVSKWLGGFILFLGICALLIHFGHYYSWKLTKWIFGENDYFLTRNKEEKV